MQHHRLDPAKHVKTDVDMAACTTRPCHVASLNDLRLTADIHFFPQESAGEVSDSGALVGT